MALRAGPMTMPQEVLCMMFTEFLSKPAIHFASAWLTKIDRKQDEDDDVEIYEDAVIWGLGPCSYGCIKSGYTSAQTLNKTCKLSRDVVRRATVEPTNIQFDDGTVSVDASTDLLCFVVSKHWQRQWTSPYHDELEGIIQGLNMDHAVGRETYAGQGS
jgi:hypothetical protein